MVAQEEVAGREGGVRLPAARVPAGVRGRAPQPLSPPTLGGQGV